MNDGLQFFFYCSDFLVDIDKSKNYCIRNGEIFISRGLRLSKNPAASIKISVNLFIAFDRYYYTIAQVNDNKTFNIKYIQLFVRFRIFYYMCDSQINCLLILSEAEIRQIFKRNI